MYSFAQLLKAIRKETGLTQAGLAEKLNLSTILIAKIESGERMPSRKTIEILAKKLGVMPSALAPFSYDAFSGELSDLEKKLIDIGRKLQSSLIKKKAKNLLK